jgi:hypothetical protein
MREVTNYELLQAINNIASNQNTMQQDINWIKQELSDITETSNTFATYCEERFTTIENEQKNNRTTIINIANTTSAILTNMITKDYLDGWIAGLSKNNPITFGSLNPFPKTS